MPKKNYTVSLDSDIVDGLKKVNPLLNLSSLVTEKLVLELLRETKDITIPKEMPKWCYNVTKEGYIRTLGNPALYIRDATKNAPTYLEYIAFLKSRFPDVEG